MIAKILLCMVWVVLMAGVTCQLFSQDVSVVAQKEVVGLKQENRPLNPTWCPDGTMLAFALKNGIYTSKPDGLEKKEVFPKDTQECGEGVYSNPVWSADGTKIAFCWSEGGYTASYPSNIWMVNSDGSNPQRLTSARGEENHSKATKEDGTAIYTYRRRNYDSPSWSPDGKRIAYCETIEERAGGIEDPGEWTTEIKERIYTMDLETKQTEFLVEGNSPVWSPDGKRLAYCAGEADPSLYVYDFDSKQTMQIVCNGRTVAGRGISWSPDSTMIAIPQTPLQILNLKFGELQSVAHEEFQGMADSCHWSADGAHLAVELRNQETYTVVILDVR